MNTAIRMGEIAHGRSNSVTTLHAPAMTTRALGGRNQSVAVGAEIASAHNVAA